MNISHLLMSRNAYLIMGLSSDADEKLLNKRHKEMLNYIQIDEIPEYESDISFVDYKKIRTEAMIKEAFLNLSNQKKKLYQTFFWFQLLDSKDEKCFQKFIKGEVNESINEWDELYETTKKYHYLKNGLIADLLLFEHQKQFKELGNFNQDAEQIVEALDELLHSEKFWAEFKEIFNLHNEIPLHTEVLNEFKKELPQYIAEVFFDLCEELKKPKLYKEYSETFGLNAKELDDNVEVMTSIKTIEQTLKDIKVKDLENELDDIIAGINDISEEVKKLDHIGLSDSPKMKKLKDDFASEVRSMAIKLYNDLNDPDNSLNFIEEAIAIAYSESIKSRCREDKQTLKENIAGLAKQEQQMSMVLDGPVPLKDLNISIAQLQRLVAQGGKFKQYKYCFSIILMTFKRGTDIYFIPPGKSGFSVAILPTLGTLLLGRRGFPRGPIYSLECIFSNLFGGKDLTAEVMSHLGASSYL